MNGLGCPGDCSEALGLQSPDDGINGLHGLNVRLSIREDKGRFALVAKVECAAER